MSWLDEQIKQARDSIKQAGAPLFHASAVARYVALCQVRQQLEIHDERCCMNGAHPGWGAHPDCPGVAP